ncbi:response regulator [Bacillus testis]|uniref:response regulator n=1 Tax=Bacillus testis TaxID=1622072 RepID=UPI00067EB19D|nr:response regulator [Bacillus testis]
MKPVRIVLIEDDPMVREVNRGFIEQVEGCEVTGYAVNGREGLIRIEQAKPDLVFMDIFMPEQDGLATLREIRKRGLPVDVIAVTAANDRKTIQQVVQLGAFDYIIKPFTYERMKQALEKYFAYHNRIETEENLTQQELDSLLNAQRQKETYREQSLPKGLNAGTMKKILHYILEQKEPVSAESVAEGVGLARVPARRYLDYLEKQNKVEITIQYGGIGRPVNRYRAV